jgi:hypothetical protein
VGMACDHPGVALLVCAGVAVRCTRAHETDECLTNFDSIV